jgi:Peptidase M50B-like
MKKVERYSRGTAYHEAGHAIVAWSFGLQVGTIHVQADDASGDALIGPTDHLTLVEQIAVCAAGYTAENVFDHRHPNRLAAACDQTRIRKLAGAFNGGGKKASLPGINPALNYAPKGGIWSWWV